MAESPDPMQWRKRAQVELFGAAQPLPESLFWQTAPELRVDLSAFTVSRVSECPASALESPATEFCWTPSLAARRLAATTLAELAERGGHPTALLLEVVDRMADQQEGSLGQWLSGLPAGGLVAVVRAASGQLVSTRNLLAQWPPQAAFDPAPLRWTVAGRPVLVSASATLMSRRGGRVDRLGVLLGATPSPDRSRHEAGHLALATTLAHGVAPNSILLLWPTTGGRELVPVDDELLDVALGRCVDALAQTVGHREAVAADRRPGRHCQRCDLRADCPFAQPPLPY